VARSTTSIQAGSIRPVTSAPGSMLGSWTSGHRDRLATRELRHPFAPANQGGHHLQADGQPPRRPDFAGSRKDREHSALSRRRRRGRPDPREANGNQSVRAAHRSRAARSASRPRLPFSRSSLLLQSRRSVPQISRAAVSGLRCFGRFRNPSAGNNRDINQSAVTLFKVVFLPDGHRK
jgi:hypothetical protein